MWAFCLSALRSGFRSRAVLLILVLGTLLVGVAFLAASFSPRQPKTVTMDVGFSGIRFSLILFAVFWVQELVGREVELPFGGLGKGGGAAEREQEGQGTVFHRGDLRCFVVGNHATG